MRGHAGLPWDFSAFVPRWNHVLRRNHACHFFQVPTNAYHPVITNLTEARKNFQSPGAILSYLRNVSLKLPNKPLSQEMALNLTQVKLLDFCAWPVGGGEAPDPDPQACFVQSAQSCRKSGTLT